MRFQTFRCLAFTLLAAALSLLVAAVATPGVLSAQDTTKAPKGRKQGGTPKRKLETPADSAKALARKEENRAKAARNANTRALFASTEPIEFTLVANFGAIARDRDTLSTKRFSGTLILTDSAGAERRIPVTLRTRGHFRLLARNCRFVPLRIEFPDSGLKRTPFAGQQGVKLGTHCQNGDDRYDDYTRREYLAYKIFNVVNARTLRARLASATYVDSASAKPIATRTALFIENEDDFARRIGGKIRELRGALFDDVQREQLLDISLFQYAIGNTDFSLVALHNIRIAQLRDGTAFPIAYDFDFSGLVNAHYATPDPRMGIRTVRDRRFRGPCRPADEYQTAAMRFVGKKSSVFDAIAAVPGMKPRDQQSAREYLEEFFASIEKPAAIKRNILDACELRPGL